MYQSYLYQIKHQQFPALEVTSLATRSESAFGTSSVSEQLTRKGEMVVKYVFGLRKQKKIKSILYFLMNLEMTIERKKKWY